MVARRKKKYQAGEGTNYISRKQALKKLQLNLKDFRRLCILKGIHPREPRNRKRAQKGDMTKIQTLYHEKDVRFLLHEPVVWKFRDFKVFIRKIKKATAKGNTGAVDRLKANKPRYSLDHIVKERYPTFVDSIRDLEDCLCLCFLYSTFPKTLRTPAEMIGLCRRLCIEFMHYVIESRSLRKVFVSIKGYYYQAEIMGQTVTWVVPHSFAHDKPESVDLRLMSIFVEFYTTMLGFVNFRLYHNLNLHYPPSLVGQTSIAHANDEIAKEGENDELLKDRVAALNQSLVRTVLATDDDQAELDSFPLMEGADSTKMEEAKKNLEETKKLKNLFKGLRFFLCREVPRENLVFMVRAFGGEVSWDATVGVGATYNIDDPSITHQISDRPRESVDMKHLGRFYIQPQWVFDSINKKTLLPVHKYFLGEILPPHLSPFVDEIRRVGDYIPPDEKEEEQKPETVQQESGSDEESDDDDDDDDDDEDLEESGDEEDDEENVSMKVLPGKPEVIDKDATAKKIEEEEYRLRTMMIKKKHKGLYKSMMKSRKKRMNEAKHLEKKRQIHDEQEKVKKTKNKT